MERATGAYAHFSKDEIRPVDAHAGFAGRPSWWNQDDNLPIAPGQVRNRVWERGHLVGSKLGGAGGTEYRNMVPLYAKVNDPLMYRQVELPLANLALAGACMDYFVVPNYFTGHYYPDSLYVLAYAENNLVEEAVIFNTPDGWIIRNA